EAEFFPAGTLSDVLKDEIQDIVGRWSGLPDSTHPVQRFAKISDTYISALRQFRNTSDKGRQAELYDEMHHSLLEGLGYSYSRSCEVTALDNATIVPLISKVADANGRDALWVLEEPIPNLADEDNDPLSACFDQKQFPNESLEIAELKRPIEEILSEG